MALIESGKIASAVVRKGMRWKERKYSSSFKTYKLKKHILEHGGGCVWKKKALVDGAMVSKWADEAWATR